ncbi:uncharacterized protein F4822DRAFT_427422 [Hypoxylon trugodes]|uniref:uncharacterized protein n=1 Tax=Hypoxylon trugodes TaxID=326681 RepID=UPI0021936DBC|nr:uncharacterized protein F4822DRAFT_427422 [Hypoxylon trugodes]KAI1391568.1 hypothetical protein F4822DRAFT_427422 [Hypoxylon trugodes]
MQFTKLAIVALLSGVGLASPTLSKRVRESIHMVNCGSHLALDFYADDTLDNVFPGSNNECIVSSFQEGGGGSCTFGSGVTFSWNLNKDAASQSGSTQVGGGFNGFHTFNCFRDDDHTLYTRNGDSCNSKYVCFDTLFGISENCAQRVTPPSHGYVACLNSLDARLILPIIGG